MNTILSLTGIRALLALWVVFFHLQSAHFIDHSLFQVGRPIWEIGYLGVDAFFILSGFIMSYAYPTDFTTLSLKKTISYWAYRIARIFPLHYFMLGLYLVLMLICFMAHKSFPHAERYSSADLFYNLINVHAWGVCKDQNWNIPSWSISAEWFMYLLFPLLAFGRNRLKSPFLLIIVSLLGLYLSLFFTGQHLVEMTVQGGLYRVFFEFLLGVALHIGYDRLKDSPHRTWAAQGLFVFCGVSLCLFLSYPLAPALEILMVAGLGALILSLALGTVWGATYFSKAPWVYLGEISYAIYLCHGLFLQVYNTLHTESWSPISRSLAIVALIVGMGLFASVLTIWIEKPARRTIRDWTRQMLARVSVRET